MLTKTAAAVSGLAWLVSLAGPAAAQGQNRNANAITSATVATDATIQQPSKAADSLELHFTTGSSAIVPSDQALLDQASRLYRDGHPIVMIISGNSDSVGSATNNLVLSNRRAMAVFTALVARGIPADRFQVLAKGATEPVVPSPEGVAEPANRRVDIRWR